MGYKYDDQGQLIFDDEQVEPERSIRHKFAPMTPPTVGKPELKQPDTNMLDQSYRGYSGGNPNFGSMGREPNKPGTPTARYADAQEPVPADRAGGPPKPSSASADDLESAMRLLERDRQIRAQYQGGGQAPVYSSDMFERGTGGPPTGRMPDVEPLHRQDPYSTARMPNQPQQPGLPPARRQPPQFTPPWGPGYGPVPPADMPPLVAAAAPMPATEEDLARIYPSPYRR